MKESVQKSEVQEESLSPKKMKAKILTGKELEEYEKVWTDIEEISKGLKPVKTKRK